MLEAENITNKVAQHTSFHDVYHGTQTHTRTQLFLLYHPLSSFFGPFFWLFTQFPNKITVHTYVIPHIDTKYISFCSSSSLYYITSHDYKRNSQSYNKMNTEISERCHDNHDLTLMVLFSIPNHS